MHKISCNVVSCRKEYAEIPINQMNAQELIREIRLFCQSHADPAIVKKYSRYFKEGYRGYGIPTETFTNKLKELLDSNTLAYDTVVEASRGLIASEPFEEGSFAILLLKGFRKQFSRETFITIEEWFPIGITNWAHADTVAGELLGPMILKGIISLNDFSSWRDSPYPFQRRVAPVAQIKPMKRHPVIRPYLDFIDPMMMDPERVVHQGLGWFLREMWKKDPAPVEEFLLKWKNDAARLIFQYATEKMAKEERLKYRRTGGQADRRTGKIGN